MFQHSIWLLRASVSVVVLLFALVSALSASEKGHAGRASAGGMTVKYNDLIWIGEQSEVAGVHIENGKTLIDVPVNGLEDLAVDNQRDVVWVATSKNIIQFTRGGNELLILDLMTANLVSHAKEEGRKTSSRRKRPVTGDDDANNGVDGLDRGHRTRLALDPYDGALWVVRHTVLAKLSSDGRVLLRTELKEQIQDVAVDVSDGTCLVGTTNEVMRYSADGLQVQFLKLKKGEMLYAIEADPRSGGYWIGTQNGVIKFDRYGVEVLRDEDLRDVQDIGVEHETGNLWAISKKDVWKLGSNRERLLHRRLCPEGKGLQQEQGDAHCVRTNGIEQEGYGEHDDDEKDDRNDDCEGNLVALVVDQATGSCFIAWRKEILQIDRSGVPHQRLSDFKQVEAVAIGLPPLTVRIETPEGGAELDSEQVTVTGTVTDSGATVQVNGQAAMVTGDVFEKRDLPLMIGDNTIIARATNLARMTAADVISVTRRPVSAPLETRITTPKEGAQVMTGRVTVEGEVSDPAATVIVNGAQAMVSGTSFMVRDVALSPGENTLTAYAIDADGRTATDSVVVSYSWIDLQVLYPYSGDRTSWDAIEIEAWVSEPSAQVTVMGREAEVEGNMVYVPDVTLTPGWNEITVQAVNEWGQVDEETVTVLYEPATNVPLGLQVLIPEDGVLMSAPVFEVVGTVSDPYAEVIVNDVPALVENGLYRAVVHACDEMDMIPDSDQCFYTITAYGRNGSSVMEWRTYRYDPGADPLSITITEPATAVTVRSPFIVRGTVHDALREIMPTLVEVNGVPALVDEERFEASVPLSDGRNEIVVKATDLLGHTAYGVERLVYEPPTKPLAVEITSPASVAVVNRPYITVAGILSDSTADVQVNGAKAIREYRSFHMLAVTLSSGENTIIATATRSNGEIAESQVTVTYDPAYPSPSAPQLSELIPYSRTPYLDIAGLAPPDHLVEVFVDGALQTTVRSDSAGLFQSPVQLTADGAHHISARTVDGSGNRSGLSTVRTVVRDTASPPLANVSLIIDSLSLRISRVQIIGTTEADAVVEISIDGNQDAVYATRADAAGIFSVPLLLSPGKHAVTIAAEDAAGNHTTRTKVRSIYAPDDSRPIPPLLDPLPTPVNEPVITIEGNAYAGFQVEVTGNGVPLGRAFADHQGRFKLDGVTLSPGMNRIQARQLSDQVDRGPSYFFLEEAVSPALMVEFVDAFSARPEVKIDLPLHGSITNADHVPLRGSVSQAVGYVRLNGGYASADSYGPIEDNRFESYGAVPLLPGWNTLWVEATGIDGSRGVEKIVVRYQHDAEVPQVSLLSPNDGATVYGRMVTVEGMVSSTATAVIVNETMGKQDEGRFSASIDLFSPYTSRPDRTSTITAWAMDDAGRIGHAETTVRYKYVPAPHIALYAPAAGQVFDIPLATITGYVENVIELTINGAPVILTSGAFSHEVELVIGQNSFNIIAKNGPKASAESVTIYYYPSTEVTLQSLSIAPSPTAVAVGGTIHLIATATYSNGLTADVSGSSDWFFDETMIDMNLGRVKGIKAGQTTVTVQHRNITAQVAVTVGLAGIDTIKLIYEKVSGWQTFYSFDDPQLIVGSKTRFLAVGVYPDGSMEDITQVVFWQSSDLSVANIDLWGNAEALRTGKTTISASLGSVSGSASLTVEPEPLHLFITTPVGEEAVEEDAVTVHGTVVSGAREVGVRVNGMPAVVFGTEFVANHVPVLEDGVIIAEAIDSNGAAARARIAVQPGSVGIPLRIAASIESGTGPLETMLRIDGVPDGATPAIGYHGPGSVEFVECSDPSACRVRLITEGIYTFTVTSPGYDANPYSAKIAVAVLDKSKLDTLLKAKWGEMKSRLAVGDIVGALDHISEDSKEAFRQQYNDLLTILPQYSEAMGDLNVIGSSSRYAECDFRIIHNGMTYSFQVLFARDESGFWKIRSY